MDLSQYNFLAVLAAAVSSFVVGGLWYSKFMFAEAWMKETGITAESAAQANMGRIFGTAFGLTLVAAAVFSLFLGPRPNFFFATGAGFSAGLCWVTASLGINYVFERRSLRLFLINGGYHTVQFTVFGVILGLWH